VNACVPELCPAQLKQKTPAQIIQWALFPLPTRTTWTWTPLIHQPTNDVDSLEARPGTSQTKPNRKLSPPLAGEGAYVPQPTGAPPKTHHKACPRLPLAHATLAPSPDSTPAGMIRGDGGLGAIVRRT
jgi:hypothetical protein